MSEHKCLFCGRKQNQAPVLFINEDDEKAAICSLCVAKSANVLMEKANAVYVKTVSFSDRVDSETTATMVKKGEQIAAAVLRNLTNREGGQA
ncbi:ClpX C4-type zinc finger protein [Klebsiella quasipneumoniae]|uniref:ClpX C4-type zinc finger protein n=1 Tax=Klebsiella quasipneumoniae TaxID=1463165 RepID=UPI001090D67D|nr:ClpX C4-type zinc finger protein [Klebsiella quasipneumoniae]